MQGFNKKQVLAHGLNPGSHVNMNRKSWHINMELFSKSFTENFLKKFQKWHINMELFSKSFTENFLKKFPEMVILHVDGRTEQCS